MPVTADRSSKRKAWIVRASAAARPKATALWRLADRVWLCAQGRNPSSARPANALRRANHPGWALRRAASGFLLSLLSSGGSRLLLSPLSSGGGCLLLSPLRSSGGRCLLLLKRLLTG